MIKTYGSDALAAIHETALELREVGLMGEEAMRRFDESCLVPAEELTPEQSPIIREESRVL